MNLDDILRAYEELPLRDQQRLWEFVRDLASSRQLNPHQLGVLSEKLARGEGDSDSIKSQIVEGFYGTGGGGAGKS